jgi:hypothetical protein
MKSRPNVFGDLAEIEGHVIAGERHIAHQHEIIDQLERAGRGNSKTAMIARELLSSMEVAQRAHLAHRDQLRSLLNRDLIGAPDDSPGDPRAAT